MLVPVLSVSLYATLNFCIGLITILVLLPLRQLCRPQLSLPYTLVRAILKYCVLN